MKQTLIAAILVLFGFASEGQIVTIDSTFIDRIDTADKSHNIHTRWFLMDLGVNSLDIKSTTKINGKDPLKHKIGKSTNINFHLLQTRHNLIDHHLYMSWGLTFEFHKYYFTNNITMVPDQAQTTFAVANSDIDKRRLTYSALTIPLMLQFESDPKDFKNSLHLGIGVYGGRLLGANFKTKQGKEKVKEKDNFNINQWQYGLRAEVGFSFLSLYGTLALNELFESDRNGGYEATPFSIGVRLLPY